MRRFKKCALSVLAATAMATAVVAPLAEPMKVLAATNSDYDKYFEDLDSKTVVDTWEVDGLTFTLHELDNITRVLKITGEATSNSLEISKIITTQNESYEQNLRAIYCDFTIAPNSWITFRYGSNAIESIRFGDNFISTTSNITDMHEMFYYLDLIREIDVSKFDTSNVTNMAYAFSNIGVYSLDVSNFNTSKVTDMQYTFKRCGASSLDVSNWDVSNVKNMSSMFSDCHNLTSIDVANWDMSNVKDILNMFNGSGLIHFSAPNWNLQNVNDAGGVFFNCHELRTVDISNWKNTTNISGYSQLFYNCYNLGKVDMSNIDISADASVSDMFQGCNMLTTLLVLPSTKAIMIANNAGYDFDNPPTGLKDYASDGDHNMEVSAEVTSHYTVQLPATLELSQSGNDLMHYAGDFTVGARGAISKNQIININCANTSFAMTGSNGSTADATYGFTDNASTAKFKASSGEATDATALSNEGVFVTANGKVEVTFPAADTYTGTASFTFSLQ